MTPQLDIHERLQAATTRAAELKKEAGRLQERTRVNRATLYRLVNEVRLEQRIQDLPTSPMTISCPLCKANPGYECETRSGGFSIVHVARVKAAAIEDVARGT